MPSASLLLLPSFDPSLSFPTLSSSLKYPFLLPRFGIQVQGMCCSQLVMTLSIPVVQRTSSHRRTLPVASTRLVPLQLWLMKMVTWRSAHAHFTHTLAHIFLGHLLSRTHTHDTCTYAQCITVSIAVLELVLPHDWVPDGLVYYREASDDTCFLMLVSRKALIYV